MPTYLSPGVYVEEVSSGSKPIEGVGTAVAAFVGFAERGPVNEPTLVTNWTQFTQNFGEFVEGSYLAHAVYGYFLNGGGAAYVVRIGATTATATAPAAHRPSSPRRRHRQAGYAIKALEGGAAGDDITVEVADASEPASDDSSSWSSSSGVKVEETYDNVTTRKGANNVVTKVQGRVEAHLDRGGRRRRGGAATRGHGHTQRRWRLGPASMQCRPDRLRRQRRRPHRLRRPRGGRRSDHAVRARSHGRVPAGHDRHRGLQGRAAGDDRPLRADGRPRRHPRSAARAERPAGQGVARRRGRLRLEVRHAVLAVGQGDGSRCRARPIFMPPSGHIAGIWARNDDTRGVHKAPANEVVRGAISLELNITKGEHDQLNPVAVNCIRSFPGQGIRVWGARTLSSDPEWRYLNVRRLFNFVEESISRGTNWVVFEPNDSEAVGLGASARSTTFLRRVWRDGALFGQTPAEAFFVKCDEENNPPENRDAGILTVEIGIAPVKPAEFVVFRISQFSGGAGLEE